MGYSIERIEADEVFLVRIGQEHTSYLDKSPYSLSFIVQRHGEFALISGANSHKRTEILPILSSLCAELKARGIRLAEWERIEDGIVVEYSMEL